MNTLYAMIPLALLLLVAAFWAFFWAVRSGQFDDLDTPGTMVLFDEEKPAGRREDGSGLAAVSSRDGREAKAAHDGRRAAP